MVTVTLQYSVLLMVTVTVQCSVLLMFNVTPKFSVLLVVTHCAVFSAPYGHCHSATYRRSAVVMNVSGPRTASRQIDAAASHSCHFNTVLYPRSFSECQLPLNCSHYYVPGAASLVQNYCRIFTVTALSSLAPLQACQHIYNAI